MGWVAIGGTASFDHRTTGWPLAGKHATTPCAKCHTRKNKQGLTVYLGTDRSCRACHERDQPHKLDKPALLACDRCHTESVWRPRRSPMKFDHDDGADAGMQLLGAHEPLVNACQKCHPRSIFNLPSPNPAACGNSGCHKSSHDGHLFGTRTCEWCHSPTFASLKVFKFDHTGQTRFDLGPRHARMACYDCHTKQLGEAKPKQTCAQCHAKDNKHGARFKQFGDPPACDVCHPSGGVKFVASTFEHGRRTKFPLTAKHAKQQCRDCHRGKGPADFERFDSASGGNNCKGCHQHTTVHATKRYPQGRWENQQCIKCHAKPGDRGLRDPRALEAEFHGTGSDFPLVKKHKGVACTLCHTNRDPKTRGTTFDGEESPECGDRCHQDSLHRGTLGTRCTPCHASGTWDALEFDHDKPFPDGGSFPLRGEHRKNTCEACHPKRAFKGTPKTCSDAACHADDDAHKGRLGTACDRCHTESRDLLFNHNTMSRFRLDGRHLKVTCSDCHPSITFKPRPTTCFGCHPEPRVHKGHYGTRCEQCHTTRTWADVKPLHDVGEFSLKGSHNSLACERCHRDNRPLAGSGNLCINCHRQDDIHNNSLSPRCGECHTQWSFAPARFDHTRVGCNLTGLHRTVACFDCHKNGNFTALSPQCIGCHADDRARAGGAGGVNHGVQQACANCHNPNAWKPAQQMGPSAFGRESVCR
jgi:hypothetical protein